MKKKKPPILQISVLVVAVLGLVIAGGAWKFYSLSAEDQAKTLMDQENQRAKAAQGNDQSKKPTDADKETKALAERAKQAANQKPKGAGSPEEGGEGGDMRPMKKSTVPSVVMPAEEARKPKPNPTSTSSQWYDKN